MAKKKHKRMDRYWQIHHRAHTREAVDFQRNLLRTMMRMESPWPIRRRGKPPIHSWTKLVFLIALMVHFHLDCTLRLTESLAYTLRLPWREPVPDHDHTTIYRALKTVPKECLEDLLAESVRGCIRVSGWNLSRK